MTSPDADVPPAPSAPAAAPVTAPPPVPAAAPGPARPEQSPEDTDAAWGEYPESRDDRLYRDRPPHWDDF